MIGSNREGHSRREEQHDKGMEVGKQKKKKMHWWNSERTRGTHLYGRKKVRKWA